MGETCVNWPPGLLLDPLHTKHKRAYEDQPGHKHNDAKLRAGGRTYLAHHTLQKKITNTTSNAQKAASTNQKSSASDTPMLNL